MAEHISAEAGALAKGQQAIAEARHLMPFELVSVIYKGWMIDDE